MTNGDMTDKELEEYIEGLEERLTESLEKIVEVEAERDEHLSDLKRVAAEFENFRKRTLRERHSIVQRANERLIGECLEVLDDLERALAVDDVDGSMLMEGVALVEQRFRNLLEREGVVEIDTSSAFDPHVHEALLTQPSEEPEGTILNVMQKGYAIGDIVLRPARVAVSGSLIDEQAEEITVVDDEAGDVDL